jgi:hypothetical protein
MPRLTRGWRTRGRWALARRSASSFAEVTFISCLPSWLSRRS